MVQLSHRDAERLQTLLSQQAAISQEIAAILAPQKETAQQQVTKPTTAPKRRLQRKEHAKIVLTDALGPRFASFLNS